MLEIRQANFTIIFTALAVIAPKIHAQPPAAPVEVSEVVAKTGAAGQSFVGSVEPVRLATIGSAVDGRVMNFPLNDGDRVEEGGTLAQLLTQTVELEHVAAKGQLDVYQQEMRELENGSRPEEKQLAAARVAAVVARVASIDARAKYLNRQRERMKSLFESGRAATEEEMEKAASESLEANELLQEAKQDLQAALATEELIRLGPREEKIAQAKARIAMQQAVVDRLADQISKYTIRSRFAGYVVREHTEVGAWVKRGDPVADVAALDQVHIVANVVDHHVPFVRRGMEVRVEIPAISDRIFTGTVDQIVPQGDPRARTFPIKILVKNDISAEGPLVKGGMYARAMLPTGKEQEGLFVPKDALVLGGPLPVVFVAHTVKGETTVAPVPVQLGIALEGMVQVTGALSKGQKVVIRGNERLRPGQAVRILTKAQ